jgi:hypothetical protein
VGQRTKALFLVRVIVATKATVVGAQPIRSAAMSLRERFSLQLGPPRKWAAGSACLLRESFTSEADHSVVSAADGMQNLTLTPPGFAMCLMRQGFGALCPAPQRLGSPVLSPGVYHPQALVAS